MPNISKNRYKKPFFGCKKRRINHITNIQKMNGRKKSSDKEERATETDQFMENVSCEPDLVSSGTHMETEMNNFDDCLNYNNNDQTCAIVFDEGENVEDDFSDGSCSELYDTWSVCCSDDDSDYDKNSECFFTYEDDDNVSDLDDDFDHVPDSDIDITCIDNEKFQLNGKRIVDLEHLFNEIRKINSHSTTNACNFNDMRLVKQEVKKGFVSYMRLVCTKCRYIHVLTTSNNGNHQFDFNYECVLSSMLIGIGFSQLEEFTSILGIPCITQKSYRLKEEKIHADLSSAVDASTKLVADEEVEFATKTGSTDQVGNPLVTAVVDAAWSKRSYRTNYSALSGSAVIIGHHTRKVLWQGVANKYCGICKNISTYNKEHYDHDCNINYVKYMFG